ncbi:MAG: flagellin [Rubricella sp.]
MMIDRGSDLAQALVLSSRTARLGEAMRTAQSEMATGVRADLHAATGGDLARLHQLDTLLSRRTGDLDAITRFEQRAAMAETALANAAGLLEGRSEAVLAAVGFEDMPRLRSEALRAESAIEDVVAQLNTRLGDRAIFAGAAVGEMALEPGRLLVELRSAIAAWPGDPDTAIAAFFAPGGGFETAIWQGADAVPTRLSDGGTLGVPPTGADPAIRSVLEGLARIALSTDPGIAPSGDADAELARSGARLLATGEAALASLRGTLGTERERQDRAAAAIGAERAGLEIARGELVGADPYDAATRLQMLQGQLEALFVTTARLSELSLTRFIR